MMGELIAIQEVEETQKETAHAFALANSLKVETSEHYTAAGAMYTNLHQLEKDIHERTDPVVKAAHEAHKEAKALQNGLLQPVSEAKKSVKQKMLTYESEQEKIRRDEEARLQEIARQEAEENTLRAAEAAEAAGDSEVAEAIISEPVMAAPVVLPKSTPKVDGFVSRTVWKFRIVNEALVPNEYKMIDEKKLGGVVRSMKNGINIPGVEIYSEKV